MYKIASGMVSILVLLPGLSACASSPMPVTSEPTFTWVQVWADEFDQGVIDPDKWEHSLDCTDHGNNDAQCYTGRGENLFVDSKGILHLVAREEKFSGPAHTADQPEYDADDFVESNDAGPTLMARLESGDTDLGQYAIETHAVGEWSKVAIRVSDLLANPLAGGKGIDLNSVSNLIAIEATGSANARIRLDNISLSCAVNEFSKPLQWDTTCSIEPLLTAE